jgi:hypothetical protein
MAFSSDLHSSLPALGIAFNEVKNIDRFIVLGDAVNYMVSIVRTFSYRWLISNHCFICFYLFIKPLGEKLCG